MVVYHLASGLLRHLTCSELSALACCDAQLATDAARTLAGIRPRRLAPRLGGAVCCSVHTEALRDILPRSLWFSREKKGEYE